VHAPVIDIHPHPIAADTQQYPSAPLGGHQSTWSQQRPVGVEQLIAEQERAGIGITTGRSERAWIFSGTAQALYPALA
jgi:hypothetical protein